MVAHAPHECQLAMNRAPGAPREFSPGGGQLTPAMANTVQEILVEVFPEKRDALLLQSAQWGVKVVFQRPAAATDAQFLQNALGGVFQRAYTVGTNVLLVTHEGTAAELVLKRLHGLKDGAHPPPTVELLAQEAPLDMSTDTLNMLSPSRVIVPPSPVIPASSAPLTYMDVDGKTEVDSRLTRVETDVQHIRGDVTRLDASISSDAQQILYQLQTMKGDSAKPSPPPLSQGATQVQGGSRSWKVLG